MQDTSWGRWVGGNDMSMGGNMVTVTDERGAGG